LYVLRIAIAKGSNLMEGRAPSRPLSLARRPRQSVALQITRKHARKTRASYAVSN